MTSCWQCWRGLSGKGARHTLPFSPAQGHGRRDSIPVLAMSSWHQSAQCLATAPHPKPPPHHNTAPHHCISPPYITPAPHPLRHRAASPSLATLWRARTTWGARPPSSGARSPRSSGRRMQRWRTSRWGAAPSTPCLSADGATTQTAADMTVKGCTCCRLVHRMPRSRFSSRPVAIITTPPGTPVAPSNPRPRTQASMEAAADRRREVEELRGALARDEGALKDRRGEQKFARWPLWPGRGGSASWVPHPAPSRGLLRAAFLGRAAALHQLAPTSSTGPPYSRAPASRRGGAARGRAADPGRRARRGRRHQIGAPVRGPLAAHGARRDPVRCAAAEGLPPSDV